LHPNSPFSSGSAAIGRQTAFHGTVGIARRDITPPAGIYCRNWGAAQHDVAEGVHRPLTLTALTVSSECMQNPLILIDADLGWWHSIAAENQFRSGLLADLGISEDRLLFCLSHTHSAPPLCSEPSPSWSGGELLPVFLQQIRTAALEAVRDALRTACPSILEWHVGMCRLATNRDLRDPDSDRILCGFNPAGDADQTVTVGRVTGSSGSIRATIVHYACHPTTLAWQNRLISPDFVGMMRSTVEEGTEHAPCLFLQGASGELAPRYQYVGDPHVADRGGMQLGYAVLSTLADMDPPGQSLVYRGFVESGAPLAVWDHVSSSALSVISAVRTEVDLPLKAWPSASELERQRADCQDRALQERLRRQHNIRVALGDGATFRLPFWGWRIGNTVVLGSMAESYSWIQQLLRMEFPELTVLYMNLVNGSIGYLAPSDLYSENIYQVWQTPFAAGSLEQLADACRQLIRQLFDELAG
jgi:hypothetical protein